MNRYAVAGCCTLLLGCFTQSESPAPKQTTYQELQDELTRRGWPVERKAVGAGVWYYAPSYGSQEAWQSTMRLYGEPGWTKTFDGVCVRQCDSAEAASKQAAKIIDVQQRYAFAWRSMLFFAGEEGTLRHLNDVLNKGVKARKQRLFERPRF